MALIMISPTRAAQVQLQMIMGIMSGKIKPTSSQSQSAPGKLLAIPKCAAVETVYHQEFGLIPAFKPLDCSKYK
jgi:hypothetical protein